MTPELPRSPLAKLMTVIVTVFQKAGLTVLETKNRYYACTYAIIPDNPGPTPRNQYGRANIKPDCPVFLPM